MPYYLLEPRDVNIVVYENKTVQDPYIYPDDRALKYGAAFNMDLNLARFNEYALFWKNELHFDQSEQDGKVKHAGWKYELGATALRWEGQTRLEIVAQHHSRHVFDEERPGVHFPNYTRYGVRIILLQGGK